MSVVRINAITVPAERVEEFERRFAARAGEVSKAPGLETFELMRPTDGRDVYLVQGDRRLTYDEHNAMVRRVAASLGELGVGHGDRVAILSANNVEWVVLWWAAAAIGAAVVPLNAWWKTDELEFGLRDSGAKLLFCDPKRWQSVRDRVEALPELEHVFVSASWSPSQAPAPAATVGGAAAAADLDEPD